MKDKILAKLQEMAEGDHESLGWDLFFHGSRGKSKHCCPGDDYGNAYERGIRDAIKEIKKLK